MPSKGKVIEELNYLSELVSNRTWTISLSILALCWALILPAKDKALDVSENLLFPSILGAVLALFADLSQYSAGLFLNRRILRKMEKSNLEELGYSLRDPLYRIRQFMFSAKVISALLAALWLVGALTHMIIATQ